MSDPPPHPPYMEINSKAAAESAATAELDSTGGSGGAAITPIAARLLELGCDDASVLADILRVKPDLALEKLEAQWSIAQQCEESGYTPNARRLLFGTLRKPGGWLYGRATKSAPDWSAYAQEQATAAAQPPPDAALDDFAAARARAHQLAPDATPGELDILAADLQDGRSPDEVLDWLRNERGRRAKLAERAQARGGAYA